MPPQSAGLLLYRRGPDRAMEVFLVHPGGPFWARRDEGSWSVPKGLIEEGEDELACARREFREETGFEPQIAGTPQDLGSFRQPSGKRLHVFAQQGDCNPDTLESNLFEMEWPPHSGRRARFPEVDRGAWFAPREARLKIAPGQLPVLEKLYASAG